MACLLMQFVENRGSTWVKKDPLGRECPVTEKPRNYSAPHTEPPTLRTIIPLIVDFLAFLFSHSPHAKSMRGIGTPGWIMPYIH